MLTVELAPGAASPPHRHNASTFVYVLEGSVVMQVKGGKEMTLGPGQTFYETPDDVHSVSRNASKTEPAKILVFMAGAGHEHHHPDRDGRGGQHGGLHRQRDRAGHDGRSGAHV